MLKDTRRVLIPVKCKARVLVLLASNNKAITKQ